MVGTFKALCFSLLLSLPIHANEIIQLLPPRGGVPSSHLHARKARVNIELAKRELDNVFRAYEASHNNPAQPFTTDSKSGNGELRKEIDMELLGFPQTERVGSLQVEMTSENPTVNVRGILEARQRIQCPLGTSQCANRPNYCCPYGQTCCPTSRYCHRPGAEICCTGAGEGRSCPTGTQCCPGGRCAPSGAVCCPGNRYCPRGSSCCPGGGCRPPGGTCCGSVACQSNKKCCNGNACAPKSATCCGPRKWCSAGNKCCVDSAGEASCCRYGNNGTCCKDDSCCAKGSNCCENNKNCCADPFGKCCKYSQGSDVFCWKPESSCPNCPNSMHKPCANDDYTLSTCCPPGKTCCIGIDPDKANFNRPFCNDEPTCKYCDSGFNLCSDLSGCCPDGFSCCKAQRGFNNNQPFCAIDCSIRRVTTAQVSITRQPTTSRNQPTRTRTRTRSDECEETGSSFRKRVKRQDGSLGDDQIEFPACPTKMPVWVCNVQEFPQACANVASAIAVNGAPTTLTYRGPTKDHERAIDARRAAAQRPWLFTHREEWKIAGCDIDEYPPAISEEGGAQKGSTVRYIPGQGDNQRSGVNMKNDAFKGLQNGDTFSVTVIGLVPEVTGSGTASGWLLEQNPCAGGKGDGPGFALKGYIKPGTTVHGLTPGINYENDKWWDTIPEGQRVGFWMPPDDPYQESKKGRRLVGNYVTGYTIVAGTGGSTKRLKQRREENDDEDYGFYYRDVCPAYDLEFDKCNNYITGNNTGCLVDVEEDADDGYNDPQTYFWPDVTPTATVGGMTLCADPSSVELPSVDMPMPTCSDGSLAIWDPATKRTYCALDTESEVFRLSPCQSMIAEAQAVEVPGVETAWKELPTCAVAGEEGETKKTGGTVRVEAVSRLLSVVLIGTLWVVV